MTALYRTIRIRKRMLLFAALILLVSLAVSILSYCMAPSQNYTHLYPQMYAQAKEPDTQEPQDQQMRIKKAYLTFDDGPSRVTPEILDVLKKLNVKATFFVIGRTDENDIAALKRIQAEGHSIGAHSYSHKYQQIYKSVEDYLDDFNDIEEWIFEITGEHTQIFRFPGGSNNSTAKRGIMTGIATEMTRRGYTYYDWNVIAHDDRKEAYSPDVLFDNVVKSAKGKLERDLTLLFHDNSTRKTTPQVLPRVVKYFQEQGYEFDKITPETRPIQFNKPQMSK